MSNREKFRHVYLHIILLLKNNDDDGVLLYINTVDNKISPDVAVSLFIYFFFNIGI